MNVTPTRLPEVLLIEPDVHSDSRGFFTEIHNAERYENAGIEPTFVQDNLSRSSLGVLRGLHFQRLRPQAKLISVLAGVIFDVAVDVRRSSPQFGQWVGVELSAESRNQLYVPAGFAHGFCVVAGPADVLYKCSDVYAPGDEHTLRWDDPTVAIDWPAADQRIISEKDRSGSSLADLQCFE